MLAADVVVSEIMYHPFNAAHPLVEDLGEEWIELYNRGDAAATLTNWKLTRGVEYTFGAVALGANQFLVVAADPAKFAALHPGLTNVVGGWTGQLSNASDTFELHDSTGAVADQVDYASSGDWADRRRGPLDFNHRGWIWTTTADGSGPSLELVNAVLTNNAGQNWSASVAAGGTPGVANSVAAADIAPLILDVRQSIKIPKSTDAVVITAKLVDELGTAQSAQLHWRVDAAVPPAFSLLTMHDDGSAGDVLAHDGIWTAVIPAQADNRVIEYYISATDGAKSRTWPAPTDNGGTQGANALYQVDNTVYTGQQPIFKLIMTEAERAELADIGAVGSPDRFTNAQMNGTFVSTDSGGTELRYLVGIRNRGFGSRDELPNNYRVDFRDDQLWNGVDKINLNARFSAMDIAGSAIARHAGIPAQVAQPVQVRVNNQNLAVVGTGMFGAYDWIEAEDSDFAANHFPQDAKGNIYRGSRRLDGVAAATLDYVGDNPDSYRPNYSKQTNSSQDDWTDLINLTKTFDTAQTPDPVFVATVNQRINVTEWMRYFAVSTLLGNRETSLANGVGDDYGLYRGVIDPRFQVMIRDLDTILGQGDSGPNINESIWVGADNLPDTIGRLLKHPTFAPIYLEQLVDLINTTFSPGVLGPLLQNTLGSYVAQSTIDAMKSFAVQRNAAVLAQISQSLTATSSLAVQNGYFRTTLATTSALSGTADALHTRSVKVNGLPATYTGWSGAWTAPTINLDAGINRVVVQAFDEHNQEIGRTYIDVWRDTGTTTNVSGNLAAGTTTWTPAGGPYRVTANLTVPVGATLVIQPGTTVFFDAGVRLTVNGKITAQGSDFQRIVFARTPAAASAWDRIVVQNNQQDSKIAYAVLENAGSGGENIQILSARLDLDHIDWLGTSTHLVDVVSSSFRLTNSRTPNTTGVEPIHYTGTFPVDGYALIQGNVFGTITGGNDVIDFTGGNRPNAIVQIRDNLFLGAGLNFAAADDLLDLDSTDAHIEGNVFMNVAGSGKADTASAISGGVEPGRTDTSEIVSVRNFFYNVDHGFLAKDGNSVTSINDTFVKILTGVFNFSEPGFDANPGVGGYADGDIFFDIPQSGGAPVIVQNPPTGTFTLRNSITPSSAPLGGFGNLNLDPHLRNTVLVTNPEVDFILRPGRGPAKGTGPNGRDMGAAVPGGATISGEPIGTTYVNSATLTVGGPETYAYKYRVNGGAWSAEIPTANPGTSAYAIPPIVLSGLANGTYLVEVVAKNSAGFWQADAAATHSRTWAVDSTLGPHIRINEVLAQNTTAVNYLGTFPDLIELYNDGQGSKDLSGMSISDNPLSPRKYVFPAGTTLGAGQYLVLYANKADGTPGLHLGFSIKSSGDDITLYDTLANGGGAVDSITFGVQLEDFSIGRDALGIWTLNKPTFGSANTVAFQGDPSRVRINEWLTNGVAPFSNDFVELFNADSLPVDLGGFTLSDHPAGWPNRHTIQPLSFAPGNGMIVFRADADPEQGPNHLNFKLSLQQGEVGLFDTTGKRVDFVEYQAQKLGVSQGLTPDGGTTYAFFAQPNPGVSNPAIVNQTQTVTLFDYSGTWRYNNSNTDLGTAWRAYVYAAENAAPWASGAGLIGHQDSPGGLPAPGIQTDISIGAAGSRIPTIYFRKHFTLDAAPTALTALNLSTVLDDAAIVYINGVKVFELGMPTNVAITHATYTQAGGNNGRGVTTASVEGAFNILANALPALQQGDNVIAVEVHQVNASSSDLVWGANLTATVQTTSTASLPLRITEINYHPPADGGPYTSDDFEFIELKNVGTLPMNLTGVHFGAGVDFTFGNVTLPAGAVTVIVKNQSAFTQRYGTGLNIAGQYLDALSNDGEELRLLDLNGAVIQDFAYNDAWYPTTDGDGDSLTIVNPNADVSTWGLSTSWRPSKFSLGSPAAEESAAAADTVVVNEVLAHPQADPATGDRIELANRSALPIDIGGWYLSNSADKLQKFRIPVGTTIPAGGFLTFTAGGAFNNPGHPGALEPFTLSELGDDVYLTAATSPGVLSGYRAHAVFGASEPDVTIGRYTTSTGAVDFTALSVPTFGAANAYPHVGPLVISEVMYHPSGSANEFIEIENITGAPVRLFDPAQPTHAWSLSGAVDFVFPPGASLPPAARALVVGIDPTLFRAKYSIPGDVQIFGPYFGDLDNGGEAIELAKPGEPVGASTPAITVDRVVYDDVAPWPTSPDGTGPALARISSAAYGNDVVNWQASATGGTPGAPNLPLVVTNTLDSGAGSLRAALEAALASSAAPDTVVFNLPPGLQTIQLLTNLPALTTPVVLSIPAGQEVRIGVGTPGMLGEFGSLTKTGGGTLTLGTTVAHSAPAVLNVGGGIVQLDADGGSNLTLHDYATIRLRSPQHLAGIVVGDGGLMTLQSGRAATTTTAALVLQGGGQLDLTDNSLIVSSTLADRDAVLAALSSSVALGFAGGAWNGPGVVSSLAANDVDALTAVGIRANYRADGLSIVPQFAGETVDANSILLKYTYFGDADLSGEVDGTDYALVDHGFHAGLAGWLHGDFDYTGAIDGADYSIIDNAFNFQGGPLASSAPRPILAAERLALSTVDRTFVAPTAAIDQVMLAIAASHGDAVDTHGIWPDDGINPADRKRRRI